MANSTPVPMRERIVRAALEVIREHGIAAMTTKQIARTAQVAEGSIYNHFANKTALVGAAMAEVSAGIREAMTRLLGRVGEGGSGGGEVEDNLAELGEAAIGFFLELLPIAGPVLGDREQLAWLRGGGAGHAVGPLLGQQALIGYLTAEQRAGRIDADASPALLASAFLGMCQNYAFLTLMSGPEAVTESAGLAADHTVQSRAITRTVLGGIVPAGTNSGLSDVSPHAGA
ncbi:AcrR family transcriptional regulator [Streptacidiphilus sp. MAP12-20]|uniref:TetR/AcrR family transcriptional regulator n=1 Tax=Streptacidiphilus sp. MAP12-20 TaxID=3156299 RepID=UPI003518CF6E